MKLASSITKLLFHFKIRIRKKFVQRTVKIIWLQSQFIGVEENVVYLGVRFRVACAEGVLHEGYERKGC